MNRAIRISSNFANPEKIKHFQKIDSFVKKLKNLMSVYVHENLQSLIDNEKEFVRNYNKFNNEHLLAWETQTIFHDVCDFYKNRIKQLRGRVDTSIQVGTTIKYYKRQTKIKNGIIKKKGDIKSYRIKKRYTNIGKIVKLLTFLDQDNLEKYKDCKFYNDILLFQSNKHWNRILSLSKDINKRLFCSVKPIEFTTGTYRVNLKGNELVFDDSNIQFKHFFKYKNDYFPLSINKKDYHVSRNKDYHKNLNSIKLEKNKQVSIKVVGDRIDFIFTNEYTPVFKEQFNLVGIDINIKHNFCTTSDREVFDYNRKYIDEFIQEIKGIDKIGYKNLNEKQRQKLNKIIARNEAYFKKKISEVLDSLEAKNVTDIVMEDLDTCDFRSSIIESTEFKLRYTRLIRLLRLGNIKKWMIEQAEKRGIRVHVTQASYSSQECPICHNIDHLNRQTQEDFECTECGFTDNADFVSPVNLKNRLLSDVLKEKLHTADDFGRLTPKNISRDSLKDILSSLFVPQTNNVII